MLLYLQSKYTQKIIRISWKWFSFYLIFFFNFFPFLKNLKDFFFFQKTHLIFVARFLSINIFYAFFVRISWICIFCAGRHLFICLNFVYEILILHGLLGVDLCRIIGGLLLELELVCWEFWFWFLLLSMLTLMADNVASSKKVWKSQVKRLNRFLDWFEIQILHRIFHRFSHIHPQESYFCIIMTLKISP